MLFPFRFFLFMKGCSQLYGDTAVEIIQFTQVGPLPPKLCVCDWVGEGARQRRGAKGGTQQRRPFPSSLLRTLRSGPTTPRLAGPRRHVPFTGASAPGTRGGGGGGGSRRPL